MGHICIRMCSHPPFSCNIMLNGHEWVERNKETEPLGITKEGNCFTSYTNGEKLSQIADTLKQQGQLEEVCQRWVYGCLWFAMDYDQQAKVRFKYKFSIYQVEYSRNLLFNRGRQLDDAYQNIITLTRERLDINRLIPIAIGTIFGRKARPYKKAHTAAPEVRIETPDYNLTIFKIHFGKLTVKLYDKGERTLRAEVVVHNAKALGCKRSVEFFEGIVSRLQELMKSFLDNLEYAHAAIIDNGALEELTTPSLRGKSRLAGIDLSKKRNLAAMTVVLGLSIKPGGFSVEDVATRMKKSATAEYSKVSARYDLRKLKGKNLIVKNKGKRTYSVTPQGVQTIAAILCLWTDQLPAFLSLINSTELQDKQKELTAMEKCIFNAKHEIDQLMNLYGLNRAA